LWYELVHNYFPFLLKTSKGTRNFIRSMTLYVSMLFYPLYEVAKRCDWKIKFFHDPTVLLLWHPIQPPPKQHFQAGNKIIWPQIRICKTIENLMKRKKKHTLAR
jgi:hypothetical protein